MIKEYHVPLHILKHSLAVAKLAVFLGERLQEKGIVIDIKLVERACLLHDLVRVCDFKALDYSRFKQNITEHDKAKWEQIRTEYKNVRHEDAAYYLLKEKYSRLALVIRKHRYISILDEKQKPNTWEEKLIYYADMRVMHDKIVPLEERLKDGHQRNVFLHKMQTENSIDITRIDPLIYDLENEIMEQVCLKPVEVTAEFIDLYLNTNAN